MFRQRPVMTLLLFSVLSVCFISARAADRQIEAPISGREIQYGNYSTYSAAPEARAVFTAPATAPASAPSHDDPVFASRNPTHPYNPPQHHPSSEGGYGGGKPKTDSRSLSVDKSPPELQFGLSFTVPFISLSTDKLLSAVTGKSSDYSDAASLLKLNVGGLVVAAVVGIAALFFVPSLFPGKLASLLGGGGGGGYGFMPNIMEHFFPGFNKPIGYGQYDTNPFPDPYSPDYNNQNHYKHAEGYDGRGRAIRGRSANETDFFSQVRRTMVSYLGNMEGCATQVMCLQGKRALDEEKLKNKEANEVTGGKSSRRGRKIGESEEGLLSLSSLEHVLEAAKGIKRITKQAPIVLELRNAFTAGKNGADCIKQYKSCPVTSDRFANTIQNVGNYIFNS